MLIEIIRKFSEKTKEFMTEDEQKKQYGYDTALHSRGGIGTTRSGKRIENGFDSATHKNFTHEDHMDAVKAHEEAIKAMGGDPNKHILPLNKGGYYAEQRNQHALAAIHSHPDFQKAKVTDSIAKERNEATARIKAKDKENPNWEKEAWERNKAKF